MLKVYLDNNYPKNLAEGLQLVHKLQHPIDYEIIRTQHYDKNDIDNSIVFLFDRSKKGLDIITEKHFEAGYKVFAFKLSSTDRIDLFQLSLITYKFWSKILETISLEVKPFVFTYNYKGKKLKKEKG